MFFLWVKFGEVAEEPSAPIAPRKKNVDMKSLFWRTHPQMKFSESFSKNKPKTMRVNCKNCKIRVVVLDSVSFDCDVNNGLKWFFFM